MNHLFEFSACGYFAAPTREAAMEIVMRALGLDREDTEEDFVRDVPDDEVIEPFGEDPWDHPAEVEREHDGKGTGSPSYKTYHLRLSAAEHAALAPEWGYCFGGEQ